MRRDRPPENKCVATAPRRGKPQYAGESWFYAAEAPALTPEKGKQWIRLYYPVRAACTLGRWETASYQRIRSNCPSRGTTFTHLAKSTVTNAVMSA